MKYINKIFIALMLLVPLLIVGCGGSGIAGAPYAGTWQRQSTMVDGSTVSTAPATMVLTASSFDSSTAECSNSGSIEAQGNVLMWTVEQSDCPGIIGVGSVTTHTYTVSPDGNTLTLVNNEFGAEVKEVYRKA